MFTYFWIYFSDFCTLRSLLVTVVVISISVLYVLDINRKKYWKSVGVPVTKSAPFVGHTFRRLGLSDHLIEFYDDLYKNHGGKYLCGIYDLWKPCLVVGDLGLIRDIFVKDFNHFQTRKNLHSLKVNYIIENMLPNMTGPKWQEVRGAVSPVFTSSKMNKLYPFVLQQANLFVDVLRKMSSNKKDIKMRDVCGQYTMDTIASCAFGIDSESMESNRTEFTDMASRLFLLSPVKAIKYLALTMAPFMIRFAKIVGYDITSDEFRFFVGIVSKTLRIRFQNGNRRGDFLDMMAETKRLSESSLAAQTIVFLLAGYNNVSNVLSFALHLLAMNPSAQDNLRRELQRATAHKKPEDMGYEVLSKLPFLDAVVKETLRMYPSDPVLERICTEDYQIRGSNIVVREGEMIVCPIWSIHRDPRIWPHPDTFDPGRFLVSDHKNHLLSFGLGPRCCIGVRFAYLTVKVALYRLICSFKILQSPTTSDPPPIGPRCFLSIRAENGLPLVLEELGNN